MSWWCWRRTLPLLRYVWWWRWHLRRRTGWRVAKLVPWRFRDQRSARELLWWQRSGRVWEFGWSHGRAKVRRWRRGRGWKWKVSGLVGMDLTGRPLSSSLYPHSRVHDPNHQALRLSSILWRAAGQRHGPVEGLALPPIHYRRLLSRCLRAVLRFRCSDGCGVVRTL